MSFINNMIVQSVQLMPKPVVKFFAQKYIAGESIEDAIKVTKDLNSKGIWATIDVLGEAIQNKSEALEARNECLKVLDSIRIHDLKANLSLKPTQLGLGLDKDFAYELIAELVEKAESFDNFVRIDMEDSPYTDVTIEVFKKLREKYQKVGIVLQAYLRRTMDDVKELNALNTNYRLCKGIYVEPEEIAFKDRQTVRDNYLAILKEMFTAGVYVGIATHDEYLVEGAYKMIKEMNVPKDKYEFQMLYGVRESLRDMINADGHKIRIYVPYGEHWYKYSIRRFKENPQMAGYVAKSVFSFK